MGQISKWSRDLPPPARRNPSSWFDRFDSLCVRYQASARMLAVAGLLASALPNIFAVIVRFTEAGTTAFIIRFSRPGIILDRFSRRAVRPSDTHCSTVIGFIGMVRISKPNLASTGVLVGAGGTTVTCTPRDLNS